MCVLLTVYTVDVCSPNSIYCMCVLLIVYTVDVCSPNSIHCMCVLLTVYTVCVVCDWALLYVWYVTELKHCDLPQRPWPLLFLCVGEANLQQWSPARLDGKTGRMPQTPAGEEQETCQERGMGGEGRQPITSRRPSPSPGHDGRPRHISAHHATPETDIKIHRDPFHIKWIESHGSHSCHSPTPSISYGHTLFLSLSLFLSRSLSLALSLFLSLSLSVFHSLSLCLCLCLPSSFGLSNVPSHLPHCLLFSVFSLFLVFLPLHTFCSLPLFLLRQQLIYTARPPARPALCGTSAGSGSICLSLSYRPSERVPRVP